MAIPINIASRIVGEVLHTAAYNRTKWPGIKARLISRLEPEGLKKTAILSSLEDAMTEFARTANGRLGYPSEAKILRAMINHGLVCSSGEF